MLNALQFNVTLMQPHCSPVPQHYTGNNKNIIKICYLYYRCLIRRSKKVKETEFCDVSSRTINSNFKRCLWLRRFLQPMYWKPSQQQIMYHSMTADISYCWMQAGETVFETHDSIHPSVNQTVIHPVCSFLHIQCSGF